MKKAIIRAQYAVLRFNRTRQPLTTVLTSAQLDLLFAIAASDDAPRPSELAEQLGITRSQVAKGLAPLLKQDYVSRTIDPGDGRSYTLTLTKRGTAITDGTLATQYYGPLLTARQALGKKRFSQLVKLLEAADDAIQAEDATVSPLK